MSQQDIAQNRFVQGVSNAEYHKRQLGVVSNSALKHFNRCPAAYRHFIDAPPEPPTPAMLFGSLVHTVILEPALTAKQYVVPPEFGDCRNKDNKAARDSWRERNAALTAVTQDDLDKAFRMRDAVMAHTDARFLIENSEHEVSGFWVCPDTGLQCKIRADALVAGPRIIADVKTCIDAGEEEFGKAIANFSYHKQAALYCSGADVIMPGNSPFDFVFLAIEKEPPFLVAAYSLNRDELNAKIFAVAADMARFRKCVDEDSWPAFGSKIRELSLPRWAK